MLKRIFLVFFLVFLVGCKSTNSNFGKKKRQNQLVDKRVYREQLKNKKGKSVKIARGEKLEATSSVSVNTDIVNDYIDKYKDIAKENMANNGIPASIILAQGILESGSGRGTLSVKANNHFGIKCHAGWTGESVRHDDDELAECFRKYRSAEESFRDHSLFLTTRNRYSDLFLLDKGDYEAWAKGLRKAGYATDKKYPEKLISLIERYELYNYDNEVLGLKTKKKTAVKSKKDSIADSKNDSIADSVENRDSIENSQNDSIADSVENRDSIENSQNDSIADSVDNRDIIAIPTTKVYVVSLGDTLYSISRRHNMTVDELQELNNLTDNNISEGQILKIK